MLHIHYIGMWIRQQKVRLLSFHSNGDIHVCFYLNGNKFRKPESHNGAEPRWENRNFVAIKLQRSLCIA